MLRQLRRVAELLEQDADTDLTPLHQRDRELAARMPDSSAAPHRMILQWAALRDPEWARVEQAGSAAPGLVLVLLGLLLGIAACTGALYFEGGGRVNVVALLGLLVGLQLLSLLFTLIAMLPAAARRRVPGLQALADALSVLSPAGALLGLLRRWLPQAVDAMELLGGATQRDLRLYARVRRWSLWCLSQGFAVAFNLGVLASFMALVVFTDLAFGWSTTLKVDATTMHALGHAMALPWSQLVPEAVPDLALVEASRFFRAEGAASVDPELLGNWWPFVLAALLCYGLMPRLGLLLFARWRRGRAERWTLVHLPGASELLYRLSTELVTTHDPEQGTPEPRARQPSGRVSVAPASGACTLVLWGDFEHITPEALNRDLRTASGLDPAQVLNAGGSRAPEQDRSVIGIAAAAGRPVALAVKSWEPPLADFTDFLRELRDACEETRALVVVPMPMHAGTAPARPDVVVWRDRLSRLGDPWLSLRAGASEVAP